MFKTKKSEIKNLIWDLVVMEESVDAKGKKVIRSAFPKKLFKSCWLIKQKIMDQVQIHYKQTVKNEDGTESFLDKSCDYKTWNSDRPENAKYLKEQHSDVEVDFDDNEIEVLKLFYKERDEILAINPDSLDEFKKAIGV